MDAMIEGEDNDYVKVYVTDNTKIDHDITVDKDEGKIIYLQQDGYPEQDKRSDEQDLRIEQAMEFAKYYIQRERGYPTFEPRLTPEWIAYALGAVFALDFDEFDNYFGEYAHQYHSTLRPEIDPIVEFPHEDAGGGVVFRADVFLGLDFHDYLNDPDERDPIDHVEGITDDYDLVTALSDLVDERLDPDGEPVEEVSAVDILYQTRVADGTIEDKTIGQRSHTQDRPADAQLQMTPPQATLEQDLSNEIIQGLVLHHLTCQVRDAYLRLGLEPPEPFRILGQGLYEQTIRYQHTDVYKPYHLTDADIDGYRSPGFDTGPVESGSLDGPSTKSSLSGLIKRALFGQ